MALITLRQMLDHAAEHNYGAPAFTVMEAADATDSPAICQRSMQLGFSSVMKDGSLRSDMKTPASCEPQAARRAGSSVTTLDPKVH